MNYQVATEEVRAAGRSMKRAGEQLGSITPHTDLEGVAGAMPGSAAAASAATLVGVWTTRFERITEATTLHGTLLASDADTYDESDAAVDTALTGRAPTLPGPS